MKKQITSPCNDCSKWKRFFCILSCQEYNQWNMDQNIRPYFAAPDAVEPFTDLNSKDELIDMMSSQISELQEENSLFKAAEQYARQEQAQAQAIVMDKDREIKELSKYRSNNFRNTVMLKTFIADAAEEQGLMLSNYPDLLPSGPDEEQTLYDEVQSMDEILDVPIATRCDYCREVHDPRVACPEYAATLKGVEKLSPGEPDPRD